ncbi:MAG: AarF/UbiB family protein [Candidatus Dojkabacteria bacterium]|nr:AarF/UbiB family protein [Candidatus Dojkabacteria bacterium]MDQ7020322.1 AarF/UbiB family protein [Candidatus Dojkabacteria bacterium]
MNSVFKITKFLRALYPLLSQGHKLGNPEIKAKSIELRQIITELGPTYIKFGQMLSVRYDLLHKITCKELQVLLDSGEPIEFEIVENLISEELGENASHILEAIDDTAIAVASLGQVHIGYLSENEKVAIKIQKPGMEKLIREDVGILKNIVKLSAFIPQIKQLQLGELIKEFENWTLNELDYSIEASSMEKFRENFQNDTNTHTPKVYREYSTDKILVTEFIEGPSIKELLDLFKYTGSDEQPYKGKIYSRKMILDLFTTNIYRQIFTYGLVHADPHPSNIILNEPNKISYIDFGIVTMITKTQVEEFKNIAFALISGDYLGLTEAVLKFDQEEGAEPKDVIAKELKKIVDKLETSIAESYSPTAAFTEAMFVSTKLGIQFPMYLVLLGKVLAIYDGMLQIVAPTSNILEMMKPLFEKEQMNMPLNYLNTDNFKKDMAKAYRGLLDWKENITSIPKDSAKMLKGLTEDGIKINVNQTDNEKNKQDKYKLKIEAVLFTSTLSFLGFMMMVITEKTRLLLGIDIASLLFIIFIISIVWSLRNLLKE